MSQINTKFSYNGVEYEFDMRDADNAELYDEAIQEMAEAEKTMPKDGKVADIYRAQCKMLKAFFDHLLGPGAGDAICTEKSNIGLCYEAYYAFIEFVKAQKDNVLEFRNVFSRYSNRPQRHGAPVPAKAAKRGSSKK